MTRRSVLVDLWSDVLSSDSTVSESGRLTLTGHAKIARRQSACVIHVGQSGTQLFYTNGVFGRTAPIIKASEQNFKPKVQLFWSGAVFTAVITPPFQPVAQRRQRRRRALAPGLVGFWPGSHPVFTILSNVPNKPAVATIHKTLTHRPPKNT